MPTAGLLLSAISFTLVTGAFRIGRISENMFFCSRHQLIFLVCTAILPLWVSLLADTVHSPDNTDPGCCMDPADSDCNTDPAGSDYNTDSAGWDRNTATLLAPGYSTGFVDWDHNTDRSAAPLVVILVLLIGIIILAALLALIVILVLLDLDCNTGLAVGSDPVAVLPSIRPLIHTPPFVAACGIKSVAATPDLPMYRYKLRLPLIFFRISTKFRHILSLPVSFFPKFIFRLPCVY